MNESMFSIMPMRLECQLMFTSMQGNVVWLIINYFDSIYLYLGKQFYKKKIF